MTTKRRNKNAASDRPPHPHRSFIGTRGFDKDLEFDASPSDPPSPWLKIAAADAEGDAAIGLVQSGTEYLATFAWRLSSATPGDARSSSGEHADDSASTMSSRIIQRSFGSLRANERLCWRYFGGLGPEDGARISLHVIGIVSAADPDAALAQARDLQTKARVVLHSFADHYGFAPLADPPVPVTEGRHVYEIRPASLLLTHSLEIGYSGTKKPGTAASLPFPVAKAPGAAQDMPHLLSQMAPPMTVDVIVSGLDLTPTQIEEIGRLHHDLHKHHFRLAYGDGDARAEAIAENFREFAIAYLAQWGLEPTGYKVGCRVTGNAPVAESLLRLLGEEVFHGRPVTIATTVPATSRQDAHGATKANSRVRASPASAATIDLSSTLHVHQPPPPVMPDPQLLERIGVPRLFTNPALKLPADGVHVGTVTQQGHREELLFPEADRDRHCYIVGATGTGKSTLLRHLISQDIQRGAGVVVLDPHGDLYHQLLECIPANRASDLVALDPTQPDRVASINMLDCPGPNKALQQNFVINEFSSMFERMYNMREAGGPGFEQYMRFALMLLMSAPPGQATLADLLKVFDDEDFRKQLLSTCQDRFVREFWAGAERRSGEQTLSNWGNYVTSKFSPFIGNPLVRPIISQPESTIDFRRIMDRQQILLVNLSKGVLGERDSHFLGSLVVTKLLAATLSRATLPKARRKPVLMYLDEFQNFTGDSLATVLSEARKYGLSMTIAHQHVSQLPTKLFESIMGNTAIKLIFRLGMIDAERLEAYTRPSFGKEDLAALPDFHAACVMISGNAPMPPFVCETFMGRHVSVPDKAALAARMVSRSMQKYTRNAAEVEQFLQGGPAPGTSDQAAGSRPEDAVQLLGGFVAARPSKSSRTLAEKTDGILTQWREILALPAKPTAPPTQGRFYRSVNGSLVLAIGPGDADRVMILIVEGNALGRWPPGSVYPVAADGGYDLSHAVDALTGLSLESEAPYLIEGYSWGDPAVSQQFHWLSGPESVPPRWSRLDLQGGGFFRTLNRSLVFIQPESDLSKRLRATVCVGGHGDKSVVGEKPQETYPLTDSGQLLLSPDKANSIMDGAPSVMAVVSGMSLAERLPLRQQDCRAGDESC